MDITTIIELVKTLLNLCVKKDGEEVVLDRLRNHPTLCRWALRSELQSKGLHGRELTRAVNNAMDALDTASDEELKSFIKTTK